MVHHTRPHCTLLSYHTITVQSPIKLALTSTSCLSLVFVHSFTQYFFRMPTYLVIRTLNVSEKKIRKRKKINLNPSQIQLLTMKGSHLLSFCTIQFYITLIRIYILLFVYIYINHISCKLAKLVHIIFLWTMYIKVHDSLFVQPSVCHNTQALSWHVVWLEHTWPSPSYNSIIFHIFLSFRPFA